MALDGVALSGFADETGSPRGGAIVSVRKLTGEPFNGSSRTDQRGHYAFPKLPDGEYSVEATLEGFDTVLYKPVRIYFPAEVQRSFVLSVIYLGTEGGVYASSQLVGELV